MAHRKTLYRSVIFKKSLWIILFILIYVLGTHLHLPATTSVISASDTDVFTSYVSEMFGSYRNQSIFSLGLGPWMTTSLIIMILRFLKWFNIDRLSQNEITKIQYFIVLLLGFWQSESIVNSFTLSRVIMESETMTRLFLRLVLVAGTFLLIWMVNVIGLYGFGGSLIIIIVNIVLMLLRTTVQLAILKLPITIYGVIIVGLIIFIGINVLMSRSEYRILVNRLLVNNEFQQSYIAIKLNSSGSMAFMLGMTAVFFVKQLFLLLHSLFVKNSFFLQLYNSLDIHSLSGAIFYTFVLVVLTYAFNFIYIDPIKMAQTMQKSGDYINGVRPGMPTKQFLEKKVKSVSMVGVICVVLFLGVPNIIAVFYEVFRPYAMLPGSLLLLSGSILTVYDQIRLLTLGKLYRANIFEEI